MSEHSPLAEDGKIPLAKGEEPAQFYAWIFRAIVLDTSNAVYVVIIRQGSHILGEHEATFDVVVPPGPDDDHLVKELADAGWATLGDIAHYGTGYVVPVERDGDEPDPS